ncbi:TPA: receptor-recognizing protein, partial [Escherichia coli]|nr:receptor-recognizing protein [Escherichia coli]
AGGACYGNSGNRYGGGAAGAAVMGNAPQWIAVGAIYGSRV